MRGSARGGVEKPVRQRRSWGTVDRSTRGGVEKPVERRWSQGTVDRSTRGGVEKPVGGQWSQGTMDRSARGGVEKPGSNGGPKAPWTGQLAVVLKNRRSNGGLRGLRTAHSRWC